MLLYVISYHIFISNHDRPFMVILTWSLQYYNISDLSHILRRHLLIQLFKLQKSQLIHTLPMYTVTP